MNASWGDRLAFAAAMIAACGAIVLLLRFLIGDRSRGRRRCPKCWYDMASTPGLRCPECGRTARSEQQLLRTKHSKRTLLIAVLVLLLAIGTAITPKVRRDGWTSVLPSRAAAFVLAYADPGDRISLELGRRLGVAAWPDGSLKATADEPELIAIVERTLQGAPFARPDEPRWNETYGKLWDSLRSRARLSGAKGDQLIVAGVQYGPAAIDAFEQARHLPVQIVVRSRPRLPEGSAIPLSVDLIERWPSWWTDGCTFLWRDAPDQPERTAGFRGATTLPITRFGEHRIDGTLVTFAQRRRDRSSIEIDRRAVRISTTIEGTPSDILTPVRSPTLDRVLESNTLADLSNGMPALWPGTFTDQAYDDCAFAVIFDIYEGDTKLASGKSRWIGLRGTSTGAISGNLVSDLPWPEVQAHLQRRENPIVFKVRSDPIQAFEVLDAARYWDGEFSVTIPPRNAPASNATEPSPK